MSARRKSKELDTSLFRTPEHIEQGQTPASRDMSPVAEQAEPRLKRASFDLREEQILDLNDLKTKLARQGIKRRISDLAQEAIDDLLAKYG